MSRTVVALMGGEGRRTWTAAAPGVGSGSSGGGGGGGSRAPVRTVLTLAGGQSSREDGGAPSGQVSRPGRPRRPGQPAPADGQWRCVYHALTECAFNALAECVCITRWQWKNIWCFVRHYVQTSSGPVSVVYPCSLRDCVYVHRCRLCGPLTTLSAEPGPVAAWHSGQHRASVTPSAAVVAMAAVVAAAAAAAAAATAAV